MTRVIPFVPALFLASASMLGQAAPPQPAPQYAARYVPAYYPPNYVPQPESAAPSYPPQAPAPLTRLTDQQLDQVLGPIALYPDALLAPILTSAIYPVDTILAQQWLRANENPHEDAVNALPWDPSTKILLRYPIVLDQLADNIAWTEALGTAFRDQPQTVMASVQRLRAQARAAGNLYTTPQNTIANVDGVIVILPPTPDVIYVPIYDPGVVYTHRFGYYWNEPYVRFSQGYYVGPWLDLGFDWHERAVVTNVHWHRWGERHDVRPPRDAPRWEPHPNHPPQVGHIPRPSAEDRHDDRGTSLDSRSAPSTPSLRAP